MEGLETQHGDILAALREFQQQQLFSDFTIHLKEGPVHVSRILIASMSPVFRKMLTLDMAEKKNNKVNMKHVTMETWTCITEFYFGSQKLVSAKNVGDVIEVCDMYLLDRLKEFCVDFLLSCCSPENCIAAKRIASEFSLEVVTWKTDKVLADNFSEICKSEEFLFLENSELLELLEKEELVTTEDDLCEGLLRWMEAKNADGDTCSELFKHVRLQKLSDVWIESSIVCNGAAVRVPNIELRLQEERERRRQANICKPVETRPRRRRLRKEETVLVLGFTGRNTFCAFQWRPEGERGVSQPGAQQEVNLGFSAAVLEDTVLVTGGQFSRATHLLHLESRTWETGPDLLRGRCHHGMAVVGDTVYVVAGYDGQSLKTIEDYSKRSGRWALTGELQVPTDECGVTALGETILVVGGHTKASERLVQTFNVETRTSAVLDVRLPRPMRHVRAASLGNTAYFLGKDGDLILVSDTDGGLRTTSHVSLANYGRKKYFGMSVREGRVWVIGAEWNQTVACWNLQGEEVEDTGMTDLPEKVTVCATL